MVKENLELKKPSTSIQDRSQKDGFGYGVITNSSIISKSVAGPPESCTSSCSKSTTCWASCTPTTACIGPGSDELRKVKVLRKNLFS